MSVSGFQEKTAVVSPPVTLVDNSTLSTTTIDTLGYRYAEITIQLGVTNIALASCKVQHSDLANMGSAADITGCVFGTSTNDAGSTSTLPSATDDNKAFSVMIDLRGKKRYLSLVATTAVSANNVALISAVCKLSRPAEAPNVAANSGLAQRLIG